MKNFSKTAFFCFFVFCFSFLFSTPAIAGVDCPDEDEDGVCYEDDNCDDTPKGVTVYSIGVDALWAGCSSEQKAEKEALVRRNEIGGDEKYFAHLLSFNFLTSPWRGGITDLPSGGVLEKGSASWLSLGYRLRPVGWKGFFVGIEAGIEKFKTEPKSEGESRLILEIEPDIEDPEIVLAQQTAQTSGSSSFSAIDETAPFFGLETGVSYGRQFNFSLLLKFKTRLDHLAFTHIDLLPGGEVGYVFKSGLKLSFFGGYNFFKEGNIEQGGLALGASASWGGWPFK